MSHEKLPPIINESSESLASTTATIGLVNADSGSPDAMKAAQEWLRICRSSHSQCNADWITPLPTRLLDIRASPDFVLPIYTEGKTGSYAALSCCWDVEDIGLQKELPRSGPRQIKMKELPQTVRDAIVVSRALGFQYLWVHQLCIIQDDADDREREARRMHHIYGRAALTLSVDEAASVKEGMFRHQEYADEKYKMLEREVLDSGRFYRGKFDHEDYDKHRDRRDTL